MWAALRQLGDCGLAKRESCGRAPATPLAHAQVHKHRHDCRSHDNAALTVTQAALPRSASANVAVEHQLRPSLRRANIRTTGGATTTPASTVTQAALRRSATANLASERGEKGSGSTVYVPENRLVLSQDVAVRERLSQFLDSSLGYLRAPQVHPLQVLQCRQFLQPRVGYLRARQV